jgi:peptidoglycan/LPS O-acetylase OafA/YrhL
MLFRKNLILTRPKGGLLLLCLGYNHKGLTIAQAWPYTLLVLTGGIILAYAALKWYDEPVRKWLRKKLA